MIIVKFVEFFVTVMNMTWNSLGQVVIPSTSINGQFIFILSLVIALSWKIITAKSRLKVDTEIPDAYFVKKKKENKKIAEKVGR